MTILLVEPFFGGSHAQWAKGFQEHSSHDVRILQMPDKHWKWRMHGGAVTLARLFMESEEQPDLILATDMLDVSTFLALTRSRTSGIPVYTYFHENQLTYPWSEQDTATKQGRDRHYMFLNFTSALASDKVLFNSQYHLNSFLEAMPGFLERFPDHQNLECVSQIEDKSEVLPLGMDLGTLDIEPEERPDPPHRAVILWNHRWEHDKNPEAFFRALFRIKDNGWEFKLIVVGERFTRVPAIFDEARERLKNEIIHWGYAPSRAEYARLLWTSDILPVTSEQDFFGGSVVEAMYCNVKPLLPKRLAYSEHVPEALHSVFFYDDDELVSRVQRWIKDVSLLRNQQTRSFVERYDWKRMITAYEDTFQR